MTDRKSRFQAHLAPALCKEHVSTAVSPERYVRVSGEKEITSDIGMASQAESLCHGLSVRQHLQICKFWLVSCFSTLEGVWSHFFGRQIGLRSFYLCWDPTSSQVRQLTSSKFCFGESKFFFLFSACSICAAGSPCRCTKSRDFASGSEAGRCQACQTQTNANCFAGFRIGLERV